MKFRSDEDKVLFAIECDLPIPDDLKTWEPSEEIQGLFIKKRKDLIQKLKSFRRSQATKAQWRRDRYKLMQGIDTFHKSTDGKRFHRSMGRFLALRDFGDTSLFKKDGDESFRIKAVELPSMERASFLKALSSIRTHLFIESEYYSPLSQQVGLELLIEEVVDAFSRLERSIIHFEDMDLDDVDLLIRMVGDSERLSSLSLQLGRGIEEVEEGWGRAVCIIKEDFGKSHDDNGFYALATTTTKRLLGSCRILQG